MKIFISWSGELGKQIARAITDWLPSALQSVKPWFSDDIEKGANWQNELSNELKDTKFSIIIVTSDALKSDWVLYEAGATANAVGRTHACPLLFGLQPADLRGPLAYLQLTRFERDDFFKLFKTINAALGENRLGDGVVAQVFEMWWPKLEAQIADILKDAPGPPPKKRPLDEMVEETLILVRGLQSTQSHVAPAPAPPARREPHNPRLEIGEPVFHHRFGLGRITLVDGQKITVNFGRAGERRIVETFLERVPPLSDLLK